MDIRATDFGVAGGPDRPDRRALVDRSAFRHDQRAEMRERDGQPVRGLNREADPGRGNGARERHRPGRRGTHGSAGVTTDIDTAVLAGRVRMRRVEHERLQHGPVGGPRPGARNRYDEQRPDDREQSNDAMHHHHPFRPLSKARRRRFSAATPASLFHADPAEGNRCSHGRA